MALNTEEIIKILGPDGPFSTSLKGYEARDEQMEMMRNVLDAYNKNQIALIEAGTGTGKSLAYLIPAMLWAAQSKEPTVISTNTIPLQEQLLNKDIPLIAKALNLNMKAVLVKGMHNYLCLRKFYDAEQELLLNPPQEIEEMQKIEMWRESTSDGSRASLPFAPLPQVWDRVAAESDTCNKNACPYFNSCYFFKARKQAAEAQILIVNHHLLFADLVCRADTDNFKDQAILPAYSRVVLDEAHNIEDIATDYFASRVSQFDLMRQTARLTTDKKGKESGKLILLRDKLASHYKNEGGADVASIMSRLNMDLPGLRRDLLTFAHETFSAFFEFTQSQVGGDREHLEESSGENKLRVLPHHHQHPVWKERLVPQAKVLSESIQKYAQALVALLKDIKQLNNQAIDEQVKGLSFEINALSGRLLGLSGVIERFIDPSIPPHKVRWIELQHFKTTINTALVDADLDVSKILVDNLFSKFSTIILCSATLTTNKQFQFIRSRLGLTNRLLPGRAVMEHIYESPFDYKKQALLGIPTDITSPTAPSFISEAIEKIWTILQSSRGNAFVLFTSYSMMKQCYDRLEKRLREHRLNPMKQGDDDRQSLLSRFKSTNYSVLFGTDSFWEGVDVAGEALRCVIIVKLPFRVPSDPLIQARSEAIAAGGGDPFMEYSLPQAIVKFKQGFGRLIRNRTDRGCIICLDNRIHTKKYGRLFLNSLPECQQFFAPNEALQTEIKDFYRRTHFLTKSK